MKARALLALVWMGLGVVACDAEDEFVEAQDQLQPPPKRPAVDEETDGGASSSGGSGRGGASSSGGSSGAAPEPTCEGPKECFAERFVVDASLTIDGEAIPVTFAGSRKKVYDAGTAIAREFVDVNFELDHPKYMSVGLGLQAGVGSGCSYTEYDAPTNRSLSVSGYRVEGESTISWGYLDSRNASCGLRVTRQGADGFAGSFSGTLRVPHTNFPANFKQTMSVSFSFDVRVLED